ncbi:MAG: endonuclease domain-containing protein [Armatimonadota bacterium]
MTPSAPAPLPRGEGSDGTGVHYRGGYRFAGLVESARELRQRGTSAERVFWELVRNRPFLGPKFRRQHQIGLYIADLYCHEKRLVVEFDGELHLSQRSQDRARDRLVRSSELKVLRFPNAQLLDRPDSVLARIAAVPSVSCSPSASGRGVRGEGP